MSQCFLSLFARLYCRQGWLKAGLRDFFSRACLFFISEIACRQSPLAALEHGVSDADSIKAMFSWLNSEVLNLDPLVLPASVPDMPTVKTKVENYA